MLTKLLIALALGAGVALVWSRLRGSGFVSAADARSMIDAGGKLVDVRTPAEFEAGHIEGAMNIPLDSLGDRLEQVGPKSAAVVVYCRSGARSARAKQVLERAGFEEVANLGGMHRWS